MEKKQKKKNTVGNVIFIIVCVLLLSALFVNLVIIFQAQTNKDKVPSFLGIKPFIVLSGSMETEIKRGDLILTKVIDPTTLKIDDVIAFRDSENAVTTHRIIDIVVRNGQTYFITKGDNNSSQDQNLVAIEDVEGLYMTRIPGIGTIMNRLAEPTTIMMVGVGITMIFVISFVISSKKQQEAERKEFLEYKRQREEEQAAFQSGGTTYAKPSSAHSTYPDEEEMAYLREQERLRREQLEYQRQQEERRRILEERKRQFESLSPEEQELLRKRREMLAYQKQQEEMRQKQATGQINQAELLRRREMLAREKEQQERMTRDVGSRTYDSAYEEERERRRKEILAYQEYQRRLKELQDQNQKR